MQNGNITEIPTTRAINKRFGAKFKKIEEEYIGEEDILTTSSIILFLKKLPLHERTLLILYSELGSVREVAKMYSVSYRTIANRIKKIKKKFEHLKNERYD